MSTNTAQNFETAPSAAAPSSERRPVYRPAVDVFESESAYVITADLPGVADGDVEITVERNLLTLSAKPAPRTRSDHRRVFGEVAHGDYHRAFTLPEEVNREAITATLKNGVLSLTVPKAAATLPRKITVQKAA
jgi:HSP20 family protein